MLYCFAGDACIYDFYIYSYSFCYDIGGGSALQVVDDHLSSYLLWICGDILVCYPVVGCKDDQCACVHYWI